MKKIYLPLFFLSTILSNVLPSTKSIIYNSSSEETVTIKMECNTGSNIVINCGTFKDSVLMGRIGKSETLDRVLTIQTHGNDVYGWSDGNVTYTIK